VITLSKWSAVKEGFEEEENEVESEPQLEKTQEEVMKEADKRELLVLRRALSNQRGVKDEQRDNIFHTHYTVQGQVCSLIIGRGSCANMVSLSVIEKLGLQTMTHPHPYNMVVESKQGNSGELPVLDFFLHWKELSR